MRVENLESAKRRFDGLLIRLMLLSCRRK
uniref:Uncharacterized protein n=1 Tax=Nelumbo nucifera TaxID=4432 RepID=A0A822ZFS0_NELNU|nr:TPA_asm: hypothetical protein HUJ06_002202 [Nelumbo nucifera]